MDERSDHESRDVTVLRADSSLRSHESTSSGVDSGWIEAGLGQSVAAIGTTAKLERTAAQGVLP